MKYIVEPFVGIYVVDFTGAQQRINDGSSTGGFVISTKHVIFPTYGQGSHSIFRQVIIYTIATIVNVSPQSAEVVVQIDQCSSD